MGKPRKNKSKLKAKLDEAGLGYRTKMKNPARRDRDRHNKRAEGYRGKSGEQRRSGPWT